MFPSQTLVLSLDLRWGTYLILGLAHGPHQPYDLQNVDMPAELRSIANQPWPAITIVSRDTPFPLVGQNSSHHERPRNNAYAVGNAVIIILCRKPDPIYGIFSSLVDDVL